MRIGDDERVGLELAELGADLRELGRGLLAGEADVMQRDWAERGRRPIGPERVDQIGLDGDEGRAGRRAGLGEFLGAIERVQPGVVGEPVAAREVLLEPLVGRRLDEVRDLEQRRVHLLARLQGVAPVDEQRRTLHEHDGNARRAGKSGEPFEPLLRRRHIFVLVAVGARHYEAGEPATRQLGAQRRNPRPARPAFGRIFERLEAGLEHARQSIGRASERQHLQKRLRRCSRGRRTALTGLGSPDGAKRNPGSVAEL